MSRYREDWPRMTRREALIAMGAMGSLTALAGCAGSRALGHKTALAQSGANGEPLSDQEKRDLAERAIEICRRLGASYADARIVCKRSSRIATEDRRIRHIVDERSEGMGIRVIAHGAFGFASTRSLAPAEIEEVAALAVEVAKASATQTLGAAVSLADEPPHRGRYASPRSIDPFSIGLARRVELLLAANAAMLAVPGVGKAHSHMVFLQDKKTFASTNGSCLETDILRVEAELTAMATGDGDSQSRSYSSSPSAAGYEWIEQARLIENAPRVGAEAVEKLRARPSPSGKFDLILLPSHLYLPIHESVGHATELDRVLGMEESLSGGSFATVSSLGKLRYGSPKVSFRVENRRGDFLASVGYDDDGVECQDWDIVRDGVLVGFSTNREVVQAMQGKRSHGCSRADSWNSIPILRMGNVCLMPGNKRVSLDDLIADTRRGILIDGDGSFSIDNKRRNFQFGGDACFEIENGKRAGMLKQVTYQSITPDFWGSCDALCDEREWRPFGTLHCGKGDPMQTSQITHACVPARFRGVTVRRAE